MTEENPFDQFNSDAPLANTSTVDEGNPFAEYNSDQPLPSSALKSAAREVTRGIIPAATALPLAGAGFEAGVAAAPFFGPAAPLAPIVGALGGMFVGSMIGEGVKDYAVAPLISDDIKKKFGFTEEQRYVDEATHPYASQIGGLIPYLVTSSPYSGVKAAAKAETALGRFIESYKPRAIGGGLMGAWELGQEALNGDVDWTKVSVATAFGVVFNHQNRIGQRLHNIGAEPVNRYFNPSSSPSRNTPNMNNPTLRELEASGVMGPGTDQETYMGVKARPPLEELYSYKRLEEEYDALYGPQRSPVAEYSYLSKQRDGLEAELSGLLTENNPRNEDKVLDLQKRIDGLTDRMFTSFQPEQLNQTARRLEPELFAARDALVEQRDGLEKTIEMYRRPSEAQYDELWGERAALEAQLSETKNKKEQRQIRAQIRSLTGEIDGMSARMDGAQEGWVDEALTALHTELANVNRQIRDQGRDISRAHRMAAETLGAGDMMMDETAIEGAVTSGDGISPDMFTQARGAKSATGEPTAPFDLSADKERIYSDAKRELLDAGRPEEEADAGAKLAVNRYVTRASAFRGARGTPYALYLEKHAKITGWDRGPTTPPAPPSAPSPASGGGEATTGTLRAAEANLAERLEKTNASLAEANADLTKTVTVFESGTLPEAPTATIAPDATAQWERFASTRKEATEKSKVETSYNRTTSRLGADVRQKSRQNWEAGNIVDAGFVKNLLVVSKNEDGSFLLVGKPDKAGQSQSYVAEPHKGVSKEGKVDFLSATEALRSPPAAENSSVISENEPITEPPAVAADVAPAEPAAAGPKVGDTITMNGVKYKIAAIDEKSADLVPTRKKDNAAAVSFPRAALDQMLGEHVAPAAQAAGEKIMLNGETLDPKLAEIVRAKLAEQKEAPQEATAGRLPDTADEASLRAKLRQESMQSDEVFYQSKEADKSRFDELAKQKKEAEARGEEPPPPPDDLQPTEVYSPLDDAAFGLKATDVENDVSLLAYLDSVGGLAPDSELAALFDKNVPRYSYKTTGGGYEKVDAKTGKTVKRGTHSTRSLIREGGLTLDQALENAVREGYLTEEGDLTGGNAKLSPNDLLDKIRQEANGTKVFRQSAGEGDLKARMREGEQFLAGVKKAKTAIVKEAKLDRAIKRVLESDAGDRVLTLASDIIAKEPGAWTPKEAINEALGQYERELQRKFDENPEIREARINKYGQTPDWDASYVKYGEVGWFDTLSGEWASAEKASELDARAAQIHSGKSSEAGGGATGEGGLSSRTSEAGGRSGEPSGRGQAGDGTEYFQRTGKGKAERALGKFIRSIKEIWLKPDANPTTIIHEHGHEYLEQMVEDAVHEAAPQWMRDDLETVKGWVGWKSHQTDFTTKQHEKFARGFERYLFDGIAPTRELASVFRRFADWMREVYRTVAGLNTPETIPPHIKEVFDRLLSSEPHQFTVAGEGAGPRTIADVHEAEARSIPTPEKARPLADRARAEAWRAASELPEEVKDELSAAAERTGTGQSIGGIGGGEGRTGGMASDSRRPTVVTSGSASRASNGAKLGGRAEAENFGSSNTGESGRAEDNARNDFYSRDGKFVDKAGNIIVTNVTNESELIAAVKEVAEGHDGFSEARRGIMPDAIVDSLAEQIGLEGMEESVKRWTEGQAFNAENVMALRLVFRESAFDLRTAAQALAKAGSDWMAARDYAVAKERHIMLQRVLSGVTAEAGRALRAFRDISGDIRGKELDKLIRQNTGDTLYQLLDEAKVIAALDGELSIHRQTRHMGTNAGEMILEYGTNNLISNPISHVMYSSANILQTIFRSVVETPIRAGISGAKVGIGKDVPSEEVTRIGEALQQLLGAKKGFAPAVKAAAQSFNVGLTARMPRETMETLPGIRPGQEVIQAPIIDDKYLARELIPDMFAFMRGSTEGLIAYGKMLALGVDGEPFFRLSRNPLYKIPDVNVRGVTVPIGTSVNVFSRGVSSLHAFNRTMFYFMELNAEAFRRATTELETGKITAVQFERRLAELKVNPDALMIDRATNMATEQTQMSPGGDITKRLSWLINTPIGAKYGPPLLRFVEPFIHIASNVVGGAVLKRTPLGFLSEPIRNDLMGKNGHLAQDNAVARMVAGTGLLLTFAALKANGDVTGGGPKDPSDAAMWKQAGYQPYSANINGTWVPYHRLGVLGLLMGLGADLYDVAEHASKAATHLYKGEELEKFEEEINAAVGSLLEAISRNILEEGFMRGPAELTKAIEGGEGAFSRYVDKFISSWALPGSSMMGQMAHMIDPVSRRAQTLVDVLKAKIPGMSDDLYPRRDIWGEPIMAQTSITTSTTSTDPVRQEVYRLGVRKAPVSRDILGVKLNGQQYDDYQRIAGRLAKMQLDLKISAPSWQMKPDAIKKLEIEKTIDDQRKTASNMMRMKYKDIARDANIAKRARIGQ